MSYFGLKAIRAIEAGEKEVAFWRRYKDRLTREERQRIGADDYRPIVRPLEPAWKPGQELKAASNLTLTVEAVRWTRDCYRTSFSVRDFRPRFPRRVPQMYEPPELNEQGDPVAPSATAIEAARLDGSYTASHALSVPSSGEAVGDDHQNEWAMSSRTRFAEQKNAERSEERGRRDARRVAQGIRELAILAARSGADPTLILASYERKLQEDTAALRNAA